MTDLSAECSRRLPHFEDHAKAIGFLCFHFAGMEGSVNRLLAELLGGSMEAARAVADASGASLDNRLSLTARLACLAGMPRRWFEAVESVSNGIKTNILPFRNRLIHDEWFHVDAQVWGQTDVRAGLKKAQARAPKMIPNPLRNERKAENIWQLAQSCIDADTDLTVLMHDHRVQRLTGQSDNSFGQYRANYPALYRALQGLPQQAAAPPHPPA